MTAPTFRHAHIFRRDVSQCRTGRRRGREAFTLIELLLVMVILAILAAVVVPRLTGRAEQARIAAAKADISTLRNALSTYEVENGGYPTTEQGLNALVSPPPAPDGTVRGSYLSKATVPKDPWGNDYVYRCPGNNGTDYDLLSKGPDGREGTADDINP